MIQWDPNYYSIHGIDRASPRDMSGSFSDENVMRGGDLCNYFGELHMGVKTLNIPDAL